MTFKENLKAWLLVIAIIATLVAIGFIAGCNSKDNNVTPEPTTFCWQCEWTFDQTSPYTHQVDTFYLCKKSQIQTCEKITN